MAQEGKALVLKDISARLYYGVKISVPVVEKDMIFTVVGISESWLLVKNDRGSIFNVNAALEFKPYYRPMSSMTEEECDMVEEILGDKCIFDFMSNGDIVLKQGRFSQGKLAKLHDYYNSIHVDYRGLIPNGLALEAIEGMYNL